MIYNVLNGDALAYSFKDTKIEGETIICREALIDGDLSGDSLSDFWHSRARHLGVSDAEYHTKSVLEFEKILKAPDDSTFNLWFEYDLFCQVNMWFVLSILSSLPIRKKVYAVYTTHVDRTNKHFWNGFGPAISSQLQVCFDTKILLSETDLQLGLNLWTAYKSNNAEELIVLAGKQGPAFPYLQEVIKAHLDRFPKDGSYGRPEKVIEDITRNISTDFNEVFKEFWKRESIYGFGDTQLKGIYDKVMLHSY